jgi:phage shock protein C
MALSKMSLTGPFRSRQGLLLGVVKGLADHWGMSPFALRIIIVALSLFLAFWPMAIMYVAAAIIMPMEPLSPPANERERELLLLGKADLNTLVASLESRADGIERKIRRLEDIITSKTYRAKAPL